MVITSAPSRLPASSKLVRVRVEFLEEEVDQGFPAQHVARRLAGAVEQHVALGEIEQVRDLRRLETLDREQVAVGVGHGNPSAVRPDVTVLAVPPPGDGPGWGRDQAPPGTGPEGYEFFATAITRGR